MASFTTARVTRPNNKLANLISSPVNSELPFSAAASGARVSARVDDVISVDVIADDAIVDDVTVEFTTSLEKSDVAVVTAVVVATVAAIVVVVASTMILRIFFVMADFDQSATRAPAPIKIEGMTRMIHPAGAT